MAEQSKQRLGRGLAALIGVNPPDGPEGADLQGVKKIPIEFLKRNARNPRTSFPAEGLENLASSIREKGIIQPIVVKSTDLPDVFEIIAGERRWRAAQMAKLTNVPVLVVEATQREALELAIVENVQREDLNAIDEARGYEQLAIEFGYAHADLAQIIGKSRSHIANTLRLLKLPGNVQNLIEQGEISAGHGRALLAVQDPDKVLAEILKSGLSVREVEALSQKQSDNDSAEKQPRKNQEKDADTKALEKAISDNLGMSVTIRNRGEKGAVTVKYTTLEQLDLISKRLSSR